MYVIVATIQIQPERREAFIVEMLADAQGSVENEPGCLRFDVIQDGEDANRIYLYEVYRDEAAFEAHGKAPHFIKWRDAVKDWYAAPITVGRGSNIFPTDDAWK